MAECMMEHHAHGNKEKDAPSQDTLACMHPATPPMNTY